MANFSAVKNVILNELMPNATSLTTLDTAVSNAMIASVLFYQPHRFSFNVETANVAFVVGTEIYSVTSTYISMYSLFVNNGAGLRSVMHKRPTPWIQQRNTDSTFTGTPRFWGNIDKTRIIISPFPTAAVTATAFFHSRLLDLTGGGSLENEWLIAGQELIKARTKVFVAENTIRDFGYATAIRVQEKEIYENLRLEYETHIKSNFIPNSYYDAQFGAKG